MTMTKHNSQSDVIPAMFLSAAATMMLTNFVEYAAVIIDGVITSRTLGSEAYSSISLFNPLNGLLLLAGNALSTGSQVICSHYVGSGDKDKANSVFSVSLVIMAAIASVIIMMWLFFPDRLLGTAGISAEKYPQLYSGITGYINGFMLGMPLLLIIQVTGPVIVMDNGKALFTLSTFCMCVCNITGDLVNGLIIHGGTFGMGAATSLSYLLQLAVLMTHFLKKTRYFGFSLSAFAPVQLVQIARAASPTFVRKLANIFRDLFINRFNLAVALTTAAVAARGIQNDINTVLFCIGLGIGKTLITMTGIYYGADDRQGISRLFSYAMKMSVILSGIAGIIVFIAAPLIARSFSNEPEVAGLAVFAIRCMALGIVPDTIVSAFQGYFQGINSRRLLNAINIGDRFAAPIITACVLGVCFGSKGIMASIAAGKIIVVIFVFGLVWAKKKRFPAGLEDFMMLPDNFGGSEENNIYASISTVEEALSESRRAEDFCLRHGADSRKAKLMSLFIEEMAVNIVKHGLAQKRRRIGADYRLSINRQTLCLTLRDFCERFDPVAFYNAHNNGQAENMLGISLVMKLSKDIRYFNAFNSNNIIISIDNEEEQKKPRT